MRTLTSMNGERFTIDDEDFEEISKYNWSYDKKSKGFRTTIAGRTVQLARMIMPPSPGLDIDHIDGDRSNNRRFNLQAVSRNTNNHRQHKLRKDNKTGFKGVSFHRLTRLFIASIRFNGITYTEEFTTALEAAKAYDRAAVEYYGTTALTNESLGLYT